MQDLFVNNELSGFGMSSPINKLSPPLPKFEIALFFKLCRSLIVL